MKEILPILKSLGLNDSELKTYIAALENGAGTVIELAKYTNLSRQATYVAIESLTERGLMTHVTHGKKKLYSAEHTDRLMDYAKRRELEIHEQIRMLKRKLPELELQMGGERPVVKVYQGKEGIRALIEIMKNAKPKKVQEIADLEAMYKVITTEDLLPMRMQLKKIGGKVRGIYFGAPSKKIVDSDRFILPKDYPAFKANISVYNDKISLITFEGKMHSIIIESKALVSAMTILFDLAFDKAKKFPNK